MEVSDVRRTLGRDIIYGFDYESIKGSLERVCNKYAERIGIPSLVEEFVSDVNGEITVRLGLEAQPNDRCDVRIVTGRKLDNDLIRKGETYRFIGLASTRWEKSESIKSPSSKSYPETVRIVETLRDLILKQV